MKRFIVAASFAVFAVPAFAAGLPYEQNQVDRALPNLPEKAVATQPATSFGAPFEQTVLDRAVPNIQPRAKVLAAVSGDTRSDVEIATDVSTESPWANDHNFVAPAP